MHLVRAEWSGTLIAVRVLPEQPAAPGQVIGYRGWSASARAASGWLTRERRRHVSHGLMLAVALGLLWAGSAGVATPPPAVETARTVPATEKLQALIPPVLPVTQASPRQPAAEQAAEIQTALLVPPAPPPPASVATPAPPAVAKPSPDLKKYVVQDGDNPYDLAQSFGISEETLLAANGLGADSVLQIGQRILVPPVSGVVVSTQTGETASGLASQWKLDLATLLKVNGLASASQPLVAGEPLVLPGAMPPVQIYPVGADSTDAAASQGSSNATPARSVAGNEASSTRTVSSQSAASQQVAAPPANTRPAVRRTSPNNFPWGQCTWWAAQSRPDIGSVVIGNASSWLYSARAAGLPTGTTPRAGAIVVYQPGAQGAGWTGHVAYVTSVAGDGVHFTVSEMNFPYWGAVTRRSSYTGWGVAFIY